MCQKLSIGLLSLKHENLLHSHYAISPAPLNLFYVPFAYSFIGHYVQTTIDSALGDTK